MTRLTPEISCRFYLQAERPTFEVVTASSSAQGSNRTLGGSSFRPDSCGYCDARHGWLAVFEGEEYAVQVCQDIPVIIISAQDPGRSGIQPDRCRGRGRAGTSGEDRCVL